LKYELRLVSYGQHIKSSLDTALFELFLSPPSK